MAQNEQSHTAGQGHHPQAAEQDNTIQPDHISLRVIVLAHGSNENNDLHLSLNLDTRISELKTQLQLSLHQHPPPTSQRLIYLGRPLLDDSATLRSFLRRQSVSNNQVPAHVLHLVIREDQSQTTLPSDRPRSAQNVPQAQNVLPATIMGQAPPFQAVAQPQLPGNNIDLVQRVAQQQMNVMRQHMAAHQQHLANAHPGLSPFPFGNIPDADGISRAMNPAQPSGVTGRQSGLTQNGASTPEISGDSTNNTSESAPSHHVPTSVTMRIEETIGPNGEMIRTVIHGNSPLPQNHLPVPQANPVERSASAPGWALRASSPLPLRQMPPTHTPHVWPTGPPLMPMIPPQYRPVFNQADVATATPGRLHVGIPTVWLASSPSGPQALLFAPGHGMFTSTPPSQVRQTHTDNLATALPNADSVRRTSTLHTQQDTTSDNARNPPQAQVVVRPQAQARDQAQPQGQPQARPRNREEDILALILQRGWLFLRLYMFIYVLSEPFTWRRVILLTIAVVVCLLPRRNPLTEWFNIARRHVDNLIGPPQPPQRRDQAQQPPGQHHGNQATAPANARNRPGHREQAPMPSPEEHARRLLREHQAQNPNFFQGMLYSVEQAVALFLASLIPGVGERHVRAREDARRIVQEEEEQRRQQQQQQQQQAEQGQVNSDSQPTASDSTSVPEDATTGTNVAETKTSAEIPASSSTALDTSTTADAGSGVGIRERLTASDP